jgi:hypothetical protein
MVPLLLPVSESDSRFEKLAKTLPKDASIEEVVLLALQSSWEITFCSAIEEGEQILIAAIGQKDKPFAFLRYVEAQLPKQKSGFAVERALHCYSDKAGCFVDEEWYAKRNMALRIKPDDSCGDLVAPAGSLGQLVLSYALTPGGIAKVSRALAELKGYRILDVAKIELTFAPANETGLLREEINVVLGQLETLAVRRRKS